MTGQPHWNDLTGFRRDLLKAMLALDDQPQITGQDIKVWLQSDGYDDLNHGRLYPNLNVLVETGLVEKGRVDKRSKDYRATKAARELVRREMQSWMGVIETEQVLCDGGRVADKETNPQRGDHK